MDIFFIYTILNLIDSKLGCAPASVAAPVPAMAAASAAAASVLANVLGVKPSSAIGMKMKLLLTTLFIILIRILYVAINGQTQTNQANIEHFIFLITTWALIYVDKNDWSDWSKWSDWSIWSILNTLYKIALYIVAPIVLLVLVFKDVNFESNYGIIKHRLGPRVFWTLIGIVGSFIIFKGILYFLKCDNTWRDTFIKLFQFSMLGGWIYLFISLFTYTSLKSVSFLMIPITYLIISAIYIFITWSNKLIISRMVYGIIAGIFATMIYSLHGSNLNLTIQGIIMFIASLVTGLYLSNDNSLSHIPSLLFLSITFMIISTMMILISYNVYKTEYKNKTGDDPETTDISSYYKKKTGDDRDPNRLGKYNEYYDAYSSRMAWFTGSSILTTLGYSYYCSGLNLCVNTTRADITTNPTISEIWNNTIKKENLTWFFTNVSSLIMTFFASREIFNSSKFMYIKRSMAI